MLGQIDSQKKKCIVIGGGISGLIISYRLLKKGHHVEIFEMSNRLGGLIRTENVSDASGKIIGIAESAAHSIMATEQVQKFFDELGVELVEVREDSKARYVYRNGKMRKLPFQVLTFSEWIGFFSHILFFPSRFLNYKHGLSLKMWGRWFLGGAATENLLTPFVRGIYGVTPDRLTVNAAFPALRIPFGMTLPFYFITKKVFGTKKSKAKMVAPKYGMGSVIDALEKSIRSNPNAKIHLGSKADLKKISANSKDTNIILATAAEDGVEYTPMVSVTAIVKKSSLKNIPNGVGVLTTVDSKLDSNLQCMGVLFNSSAFSERVKDESQYSSFTLMYSELEDEKIVYRDLGILFNESSSPTLENVVLRVNRWKKAIPQYGFGLENFWSEYKTKNPNYILFGNYTGQVSIRGLIETSNF